ncbi:response regulator [Undibacterium sp. RuRC25W]|uniref:response regulator n=1 Tax=Undibacterium sp. RuRC25W TaxID=3413047 RepID=UPI003BF3A870
MIRIIIADDHALVRAGLKRILAQVPDFEVVGEAANGSEVLDCVRDKFFDVLLLDLSMPGISGADLIARVRANREIPILVVSMHSEPYLAARVLRAGASGYITKDCDPEILIGAIRKVAANGNYITPELAEKLVFDKSSPQRALHTRLSDRESEVLFLLVNGKSVNEIAMQLSISNKTVSTHKVRLMEKLNLSNMAELMRYTMDNSSNV